MRIHQRQSQLGGNPPVQWLQMLIDGMDDMVDPCLNNGWRGVGHRQAGSSVARGYLAIPACQACRMGWQSTVGKVVSFLQNALGRKGLTKGGGSSFRSRWVCCGGWSRLAAW